MYQALYRKWRPKNFSGVYGQEHVISVLRQEVASGKISHAYLFCGSRGTGKTSCAKILAKAVNCESPRNGEPCGECASCRMIENGTATDVLELDAASNNGVENVRDIRDEVVYTPAALKRRVYIIDEVHMLSVAAFNALLKTLEEPPEHVVFILATTEAQKLPATIISRCQRFDFKRIENKYIVEYLTEIAGAEGIGLDADAASLIARLSQGGMRDAISMLELCAGDSSRVTEEAIRAIAGVAGRGLLVKVISAVLDLDIESIFGTVDELYSSSLDITVFWAELVAFYRDMLVVKTTKNPNAYLDLTTSELEETSSLARRFTREALALQIELADEALVRMNRAGSQKRLIAELTLIRMCDPRFGDDITSLSARVAALEDMFAKSELEPAKRPVRQVSADLDNTYISPISEKPETRLEPHTQAGTPISSDSADPSDSIITADPEGEPEGGCDAEERASDIPRRTHIVPYLRWAEAVEKYSAIKGNEGTAGFLELAEARCDGDGFEIIMENASALLFVESDEVITKLAEILGVLEGRTFEPAAIKFKAAKRLSEPQPMDDFTT